jgi:hypothetical protein
VFRAVSLALPRAFKRKIEKKREQEGKRARRQERKWEDVRMRGCEDVKMWRWEDVRMRGSEDVKMWKWTDVKMKKCEDEEMWKCEDVKMTKCEDVRMRRCEDVSMWRWEDILQTPTIGRTLRSDVLGKIGNHHGQKITKSPENVANTSMLQIDTSMRLIRLPFPSVRATRPN